MRISYCGNLQNRRIIYTVMFLFFGISQAYAAHPLITDDTGTQGKGKFQIEFIGEYAHDNTDGVLTESIVAPTIPVISYGITDSTDMVLGISYQHLKTKDSESTSKGDGISDASIEIKHRIHEKDGLSFALKPGVTLPTGDDQEGLGAGKITYHLFFITTKEINPWAFHLNLGHIRHENTVAERNDIWHASLASEVKVIKDLKAVANIGIETNHDKTSNTHPAFILGGVIYSITENFDIDFGIKRGLNKPETDYSVLAGITRRF